MEHLYFTIYKITNLTNNKIYIGKHITSDLADGYMGSGKLIVAAIKKYGVQNFEKEILHICLSEDEMNEKEKQLVSIEFVLESSNYNLCPGGQGGFGFINSNKDLRIAKNKKAMQRARENGIMENALNGYREWQKDQNAVKTRISNAVATMYEKYGDKAFATWQGKTHREETKQKMSKSKKGKGCGKDNSQFGSQWITNGVDNRKIKNGKKIDDGWWKGRSLKKS
jgi:Putative endonuclease segE, GIY-YIG domain/NUMOD3 motif